MIKTKWCNLNTMLNTSRLIQGFKGAEILLHSKLYWEFTRFSHHSIAIWLCTSVYMRVCGKHVLCGQHVLYQHTELCHRQSGFYAQKQNRSRPKQDTTEPMLDCYNHVKRHCLELFLSLHLGEWLCGYRLFASAFTPKWLILGPHP